MKAIVWKELREHAARGLLLLLVLLNLTIMMLKFSAVDLESTIQVLTESMPVAILYGSVATALVIACLQTLFDTRRDQWAFLMHRGESPLRILLGKIMAAGILYAIITLTPVLTCALWVMRGGMQRFPFTWSLIVPMLAAITAAIPFYFAMLLAMTWKGLWGGNYFLLIVTPLLSLLCFTLASQATSLIPPQIFLGWLLMAGILAIATWGQFARSGESYGRPMISTICLGVPVFVSIFLALLLSVVVIDLLCAKLFTMDMKNNHPSGDYTQSFVNKQGNVCIAKVGYRDRKSLILNMVEVNPPDSRRDESLVGKSINDLIDPKAKRFEMLPVSGTSFEWNSLASVETLRKEWSRVLQAPDRHERVLELVGRHMYQGLTRWIYSSADGLLYGYELEEGSQDLKPAATQPRQVTIIGPDGFMKPGESPQRRFSRLLACPSATHRGGTLTAWRGVHSNVAMPGPGYYLLCEDAIYCVNVDERKVYRLLTAPAGKKIRSLVPWFNQVVIYNDAISMHEKYIGPNAGRGISINPANPADLAIPGELEYLASIPPEMIHLTNIQFGKLPNRSELVFVGYGLLNRTYHVVRTQLDGTVLSNQSYQNMSPTLPKFNVIFAEVAILFPPGLLLLGFGWDALSSLIRGRGPGALVSLFSESGSPVLLMSMIMAATTALCVWLATCTARKYRFSPRTRRIWQVVVMLLGPAGLLTLWFLRDWPSFELCATCQKKRPVDLGACQYCGELAPKPSANGREILILEQQVAPQLA